VNYDGKVKRMNLREIDLNLLPVFEAIYVSRNLTRASAELHITPPAVSNALARLRAHFGDPLFVRAGRGVKPTPAADALIASVREALDGLRRGLEPRAAFVAKTSSRVFNIAARDAGVLLLAAEVAVRARRQAPAVRLHFSQLDRPRISTELASGRLDLALDTPELSSADLEHERIREEPFVLVMREGHPSAGAKLTLERFLSLQSIAVTSRRSGRSNIEEAVRRAGFRLTPVMRFPHLMPALNVVRATDCVLAAPAAAVPAHGFLCRELPFAMQPLLLSQYWRSSADDPGLRWLRAIIRSAAEV
jgi:DNA-binding transcriptional LysR family regulator